MEEISFYKEGKALKNVPILITRGKYIFPGFSRTLAIGRKSSLNALKIAKEEFKNQIVILSQVNSTDDVPNIKDIYLVGILASFEIEKEWDDNSLSVKIKSLRRVKVDNLNYQNNTYFGDFKSLNSFVLNNEQSKKTILNIIKTLENYELDSHVILKNAQKNVSFGVDSIANFLPLMPEIIKQKVLSELNIEKRLTIILSFIVTNKQFKNSEIENKLNKKIRSNISGQQKEFYLREKLKAIKEELGENSATNEMSKFKKRLQKEPFPKYIKTKVLSEIDRYESLPQSSSESNIVRSYIETVMSLPWYQKNKGINDLKYAKKILDKYHFGLKKVKERIIEFLAVKQISKKQKGQIICFVGPPGVGKTSLAKAIAEATGLEFIQLSLGGVKDESEIRGHRKTYIGAMPGRIIQSLRKSKTINPVFLLDEIDKMSSDMRGDPASAMLEVLDPDQNNHFSDHYLEEPYDLSNVTFIATANYYDNIPEPLFDRMEIIELSSYTEIEKKQIALNYLVPKVLNEHNLKKTQLKFLPSAISEIIKYYTREAGVRQLKRCLDSIARKFIVKFLNKEFKTLSVNVSVVIKFLGKHKVEHTLKNKEPEIGVATGLAYTQYGGDILAIEVTKFKGKGALVLTGKLGEVMKESANIALGFIKANAKKFKIDPEIFQNYDIHIHIPEGAVPKDGPSAGITLTSAIISSLIKEPISQDLAMTGEITLRGKILPIGGLREKSISAHRSGITTILIPKQNKKNLEDIPLEVRNELKIKLVDSYSEVYNFVFKNKKH